MGVLLSGVLSGAEASSSTRISQELGPAGIQGYVVEAGTGQALAKARILLRRAEGRRPVSGVVSDSEGRFALADIDPGSYRLFVERDGFVDQQYGQLSPSRPGTVLVLAPDQQVRDVLIRMVPTGTIAGRVYDRDGEPIVGARVRALRYDYRDGEKVLVPVRDAQTNDLGAYRLFWLDPGDYFVTATFGARRRSAAVFPEAVLPGSAGLSDRRGPADPTRSSPTEEIYVDTYYPGAIDPVNASALTVTPASEVRAIDFTVLPTRAAVVRGKVVGPFSDQEGRSPNVIIAPRSQATAGRSAFRRGARGRRIGVNADGTFELEGVAPGSYTLVATLGRPGVRGRGGATELAGFLDIEVLGEDISGLVIPIQPSVSVIGRVLVDPGAIEIGLSRLRVRMESSGALPLGSQNANVGPDGSFQIENVVQTRYRVALAGLPEDAYGVGAYVGGVEVPGDGFEVRAEMGPLEFRVSGAGGAIDGTVRIAADQTYLGAQVVLIPEDPARRELYKVSSADQYGRFSMRGIAPGAYQLFAWEDAPAGAFQDSEFVQGYEDFGVKIEVREASQNHAQPPLIPAGF